MKYKKIIVPLLIVMLGALVSVILPALFPNQSLRSLIVRSLPITGLLGIVYFLLLREISPGPSRDIALMTFGVSSVALGIAGLAFLDSSRDSEVLQEQLTELKKITAILESKEK